MSFELRGLHPELMPYGELLLRIIRDAGYTVRVTSVFRSLEKQAQLYRLRQAGKWPYPVAPPGGSKHNYGLAWDMVTEPYDLLQDAGRVWRSWGGRWGEGDPIHFEV
ncbi:MAG: M15 family metallopeptidase [Planctomycetota bacterium]